MRNRTTAAAVAALGASALLLTACGNDTTTEPTPAAPSSTASASATAEPAPTSEPSSEPSAQPEPSEDMVGQDPSTWTPVSITMMDNGASIDMQVGQAGIFTDLPTGDIVLTSSDETVVTVSQPSDDGQMQTSAGIQAQAPGQATITVALAGEATQADNGTVMVVTINVVDGSDTQEAASASGATDTAVGTDASTWTPIFVSSLDNGQTLDVVVGQYFLYSEDPQATITSSDPDVVTVVDGTTDDLVAGGQAIAAGSATVTITGTGGEVVVVMNVAPGA